jgi:hypothetical protein
MMTGEAPALTEHESEDPNAKRLQLAMGAALLRWTPSLAPGGKGEAWAASENLKGIVENVGV